MKKIDRFDKYMSFKGLNDNKVTRQLNLTVGLIGKSRKEGRDLSDKVIEQILNFYTDLSRVWLLTGEGEMLTEAKVIQNNVIGDNINGHEVQIHNDDHARLFDAFFKSQEQISESQAQISVSQSQLTKAQDQISKSQEQLSKAQEQIDRLIGIIESRNKI